MPEGHTIHRLARDHQRWFAGSRIRASSPQGRFAEADALNNLEFVQAQAWGKHLFYVWPNDSRLHIHLGLFGRCRSYRSKIPAPRNTVRFRMANDVRTLDLIGPAICEMIDESAFRGIIARLGPDPLRADSDPEWVWRSLQRRRVSIGQALMNQSLIAGVGNVYRAELLFAFRIHPDTPARQIGRDEWMAMWFTLQRWMALGVKTGRIITTDPAASPSRLRRDERLMIYKKAICPGCGHRVSSWLNANRTVYACEQCQKRVT